MKVLRLNIIYTNQKMYNVNITNITLPGKDGPFTITSDLIMLYPLFQAVK